MCTAGEDPNQNGVVEPGETDPNLWDTDTDGFSDGDEVSAPRRPEMVSGLTTAAKRMGSSCTNGCSGLRCGESKAKPNRPTWQQRQTRDAVFDVEEAYTDDPSTIGFGPSRATPRYTRKQGQYLVFIYYYTKTQDRAPAEADLQWYFEVSAPTAHRMVVVLKERGFIVRALGRPRSIRLLISRGELPDLE